MSDRGSLPPPSDRRSSRFLERLELRQDESEIERPSLTIPASQRAKMPSRAGVVAPQEESLPSRAEPPPLRAYLETLVLTLVFPAIGYAVDRNDPFFLRHSFSWLAIAPLLIALRHGFALGFVSAMGIDLAVTLFWRVRSAHGELAFPGEVVVGVVAVAMIAGQFSDVFRRDSTRLRRGLQTARRRLDALSRAHFLLELSHDRLQQQQGPAAPNLRGAIAAVRKLMGEDAKSLASSASALLELYAAYFSVEVASLYNYDGRAVVKPPLATIGQSHDVALSDALLVDATKTRMLTHMPGALAKGTHHESSRLLAVVPFVDTADVLRGVLCIESMPFIAFERRNLEAMVVLAGHVADILAQREQAPTQRDPGRQSMELAVERALSDLRAFGKPATLAGLRIPRQSRANDLVDVMLGGALRDIDFPYANYDPDTGDLILYVLLPMSDESVALTVFDRMARLVQREEGTTLGALGVLVAFYVLRADDGVEEALKTVDRRIRENAQSGATTVAF